MGTKAIWLSILLFYNGLEQLYLVERWALFILKDLFVPKCI